VQEVASTEEDQSSNPIQTLATNMLNLAGPSGVRIANPSVASSAPVLRSTQPEMGATVKELRTRIGSIKKTMKITTAMKLVAAAKVRKAQEACTSSRPFTQAVGELLSGLVQRLKVEKLDIPLLEDREVKTVGLMVVTGDRGLCGGYNAAAIKKAQARIDELTKQGINVEIIGVGNRADKWFGQREKVRKAVPIGSNPTAEQATEIADELLQSFFSGELDRVEIVFTSFVSMMNFVPTIRTLIPLVPSGLEMEGDEIFGLTSQDGDIKVKKETKAPGAAEEFEADMIFEQEPSQLLNSLLPLYINGQVLRTLQESVASELAARMQAMQAATDNAKALQEGLEIEMNRRRQAAITAQILEIVSGAEALS
jgi:F-type H+-transporting ATPase subunit gamma